ncbi:MAG: hypothetical protein GXP03_15445 [Alphaproteobacteria bacterium]|nr:hypothetical protein [Alphaproteobacteria bacterium]
MNFFNRLGFSFKLSILLVALILAAGAGVGYSSYTSARDMLLAAEKGQRGVLLSRYRAALQQWTGSVETDLVLTAQSPDIQAVFSAFSQGREDVALSGVNDPGDGYIDGNSNVSASEPPQNYVASGADNSRVTARYTPFLRSFAEARGYADIYLIDAAGNLVYSLAKNQNYSSNFRAISRIQPGVMPVWAKFFRRRSRRRMVP